jgi:hypothetical protein
MEINGGLKAQLASCIILADSLRADGVSKSHHLGSEDKVTEKKYDPEKVEMLIKAAEHFIDKCDSGRAHSVNSYSEFKAALVGIRLPVLASPETLRETTERMEGRDGDICARR